MQASPNACCLRPLRTCDYKRTLEDVRGLEQIARSTPSVRTIESPDRAIDGLCDDQVLPALSDRLENCRSRL